MGADGGRYRQRSAEHPDRQDDARLSGPRAGQRLDWIDGGYLPQVATVTWRYVVTNNYDPWGYGIYGVGVDRQRDWRHSGAPVRQA